MENRSYEVLEFHKVINKMIDLSKLEVTKEKFIDLDIIRNKGELDKELSLLVEFIDFYKYDDGLELAGLSNIEKYLKSVDLIGSYLEPENLLDLKRNLAIFRISKSRAKNVKDKYNLIWTFFSDIGDLKDLEDFISEIVDDEGSVRDTASLGLRDLRRQKGNVSSTIKEKFDELMNNKDLQKAVQEKIITKRNERYVIPIKTDFKSLVKGIEHDRSSTGSTVYMEPLNIVSLNNKLREYEAKEREEIRKILIRITEIVRSRKEEIVPVKDILERLDFINAKVLYSVANDCRVPKIVNREYLKLVVARHPLIEKEKMVPINFQLGDNENIMLITGPNTGGKTVTLKIAGLLTLMALSGIPIPADEKTEIGFFNDVLADIGDEQSIEQNLSSFSAHIKNIKEILETATRRSLILIDELGSGTDPMEGSAFAMSVIDYLNQKNVKSIITTHYSEVKAYAFNTEGIKSSSMEFNVETLQPTYRLLEGIPGESNALIIAQKYGINEEIIKNAKSYISEENQKVEKMLVSIKEKTDEVERLKTELEISKVELESKRKQYEENIIRLENEKNNIVKEAYDEADRYLKEVQSKAKNLVDKISQDEMKKEEAKDAQRSLNMLRESFRIEKNQNVKKKINSTEKIDVEIGDEVFIKSLNQNGKILRIIQESNSVQVQAGILKLVLNIDDVRKIEKKQKRKLSNFASLSSTKVKGEVDLRGMTVDEAMSELELYLDKAMLTGYSEVFIIHGKGTMVLRKTIQEYLKKSKYITEFRDANQNEGGLGCTVAKLK